MTALPRIPVSEPDIRGEDAAEVMAAIQAGWISSAGPQLRARWPWCGPERCPWWWIPNRAPGA